MADIKHRLQILAPRRTVFEAVSTVDGFKNWWTDGTSGETSIGGLIVFRFRDDVAKFKVIRKEIHQFIELAYRGKNEDEWFNTKISIRLNSINHNTVVDFQHNDYRIANDFYAMCNYTWGQYLKSLKDFCESGSGQPFLNNK